MLISIHYIWDCKICFDRDWKHDLGGDSIVHFSGKVESYNNSMDNFFFFNGIVMYLCGQFFKFGGWKCNGK